MKKISLIAAAFVAFIAQASFAQPSSCGRCDRLILGQVTQIAENTAALRTDSAAMRAELTALTAAVAALTTAVRNQRQSAFVAENVVLRNTGQAGADSFCREVGYDAARIIGRPIEAPADPAGKATLVCFKRP